MPEYKTTLKGCAVVKQGCFNSGYAKSLQGRSDTNDRRRPPVAEAKQPANRQNGEFATGHTRKKGYRKLNLFAVSF